MKKKTVFEKKKKKFIPTHHLFGRDMRIIGLLISSSIVLGNSELLGKTNHWCSEGTITQTTVRF